MKIEKRTETFLCYLKINLRYKITRYIFIIKFSSAHFSKVNSQNFLRPGAK